MKYMALNHKKKAAYDLDEGSWRNVLQVHPDLVEYRATREQLPYTVAAAIYDKQVENLSGGEMVIVTNLSAHLATLGIEQVLPHNDAILRYPDYVLTGSREQAIQMRVDASPGLRLRHLLEAT